MEERLMIFVYIYIVSYAICFLSFLYYDWSLGRNITVKNMLFIKIIAMIPGVNIYMLFDIYGKEIKSLFNPILKPIKYLFNIVILPGKRK